MLALDVFNFCFPDVGHRRNLPLCLFHKLCVHMHGNKKKFEWNVLVQSTRVLSHDLHGKTKQLKRFIDPLNHDSWSFSEKKGSTNKVDKQEIKEKRGGFKPLHLGILCITGYPVHVAQKCTWRDELTILSLHVLLALHMDTSTPS